MPTIIQQSRHSCRLYGAVVWHVVELEKTASENLRKATLTQHSARFKLDFDFYVVSSLRGEMDKYSVGDVAIAEVQR